MKRFLPLFLLPLALGAADNAGGRFENYMLQQRPALQWELLKGYRLFFHPESPEPLRRALILAIPTDRKVRAAWSLVRPILPKGSREEDLPWLRVEGAAQEGRIAFEWDGRYRDADFPDQAYHYDVHVRWTDGDQLDQQVVVLRSQDHPKLVKAGATALGEHKLAFRGGNYEAEGVSASFSLADQKALTLTARVYAPALDELFHPEGIQVTYKFLEDENGLAPAGPQDWTCACQAALPAESPARLKARKVLCPWGLEAIAPGLYEVRLSLYHRMKHPAQFDACDTPVLDEDRVKIQFRP